MATEIKIKPNGLSRSPASLDNRLQAFGSAVCEAEGTPGRYVPDADGYYTVRVLSESTWFAEQVIADFQYDIVSKRVL